MGGVMIRSVPGALPWTAVQKWIEAHGMAETRAETLRHCLTEMDKVFLEHWHEKAKADGD